MNARRSRLVALWLLVLASAATIAAMTAGAAPVPPAIEELGRAYAEGYGLQFDRVQVRPVDLPAEKLSEALAIGYTDAPGHLTPLPLSKIGELGTLTMVGDRTPEQVVRQLAVPGHAVVETTWSFAGVEPVQSYTILDADGEPLFDTLLSLPVVPGPILNPRHF